MDGESVKALMVDSDAKVAKERSMYEQVCKRYEEGLEAIKKGILTKGGPKKRDAVTSDWANWASNMEPFACHTT